MRYMPQILRRLFQPVLTPMEAPQDLAETIFGDQITRDVDAAVREHERTGLRVREDHERRLRSAIDDLLQRIGPQH